MKYVIDVKKRPVYLQLYGQIRDDILSGVYAYNSKLPSKRSLAEETGVSTVTVEHAYALLCDEGYAEGRPRSGYVVIFRKSDGFAAAVRSEPTTHSPSPAVHAHPDFPLSVLSKTMRRVLSDRGDSLLEKSPNCGCEELREAIRRYLARNRGMTVEASQIALPMDAALLITPSIALVMELRPFVTVSMSSFVEMLSTDVPRASVDSLAVFAPSLTSLRPSVTPERSSLPRASIAASVLRIAVSVWISAVSALTA